VAAALARDVDQVARLLQCSAARSARRLDHPFAKQRELQELASVQRKLDYSIVLDYVADLGAGGLHQGLTAGDRDLFGNVSGLKNDLHLSGLAELEHEPISHSTLESGALNRDCVFADRERRKQEAAGSIRFSLLSESAGKVNDGHDRVGHNCAHRVSNDTFQGGGVGLGGSGGRSKKTDRGYEQYGSHPPDTASSITPIGH
jgi:hypothetical protein